MNCLLFLGLCSGLLFLEISSEGIPWTKLIPATKISFDAASVTDFAALFDTTHDAWLMFKAVYKPKYLQCAENDQRFKIFANNFLKIFFHNQLYKQGKVTYEMAVNQFSDRTPEELRYLTCLRVPTNLTRSQTPYVKGLSDLPDFVDWRTKSVVTGVKNQGRCGSCWAFSSTGAVEGQYARKTNTLLSFSEQQLVDCSTSFGNHGCEGGLMNDAFKYIQKAGGITTEKQYPYVSGDTGMQNPECLFNKQAVKAKVTGFAEVHPFDMEALMYAVAFKGPISIAINAGSPGFSRYHAGVYSEESCDGDLQSLNHGVLLVGYGQENGTLYWLVKNSWGDMWGHQGYIKILRNKGNMCGVLTLPSYPTVEPVS